MFIRFSLFGALTLLSASSALALTCANDYGSSAGCASNTNAAGDCATLGFSQDNVDGCEHYLYCPFDTSYKRCVSSEKIDCAALGFTQENKSEWCGNVVSCPMDSSYTLCASQVGEQVCPVGEINPTCPSNYGLYRVAETEDGTTCYECKPMTCAAALGALGSGYVDKDTYFSASSLYLPSPAQSTEILNASGEMETATCYKQCPQSLQLKPINKTNCPVGSWVVNFNSDLYCTPSTKNLSTFASCAHFEITGVVAYHDGSDIYAVFTRGTIPFTNSSWSGATYPHNCTGYYATEHKKEDYYYNYQLITGQISSSNWWYKYKCMLSGNSGIDMLTGIRMYNAYGMKYGVPDENALYYMSRNNNLDDINSALTRASQQNIETNSKIWAESSYQGLFVTPSDTSWNGYPVYVCTAEIQDNLSNSISTDCTTGLSSRATAQAIMVGKINDL